MLLKKLMIICVLIISVTNYSIAEEIKQPSIYTLNNNKYILVSDYNVLVRDYNACRDLLVSNQKILENCNKTIQEIKISGDRNWNIYIYCTIAGAVAGGIAVYKLK